MAKERGPPVVQERFQFVVSDVAVVVAGIPSGHQHLEPLAERAFGQAKISAYAAAKAAVVALSRSLALEEAKNGITVNVVNPSSIDEKELSLEEARRMRDARFPIGRPPTVEDVAATVAFFASEEAEYVTGQVVNVSGGWML